MLPDCTIGVYMLMPLWAEYAQQDLVAEAEAFLPQHEPIFVGRRHDTGVNWVCHSNVGEITFSGTDSWWGVRVWTGS